jgi:RNA polymerase sigma-70 factor (ECF subfamily)
LGLFGIILERQVLDHCRSCDECRFMEPSSQPIEGGDVVSPSSASSRNLVARVKAGDAAAWDRMVTLYAPLVYRWCRGWDLPEQEIADIFQEVFHAVATHVASFRKETKSDTFRGWLRTITHNKVYDHFRKLGREPAGAGGTDAQIRFASLPANPAPEDDDSGVQRAETRLCREVLDQIRCEFEERTWQAFWLTAVDGREAKEAALDLGMSPGAVRVAKSRVLRRLREELGEA